MACSPSSRPNPDCLKPPNGVAGRTDVFELIDRTPVSSARATRGAILVRRLHDGAGEPEPRPVGGLSAEERPVLDEGGDLVAVRGGDQRPHLGRLVARIADLYVAARIDEQVEEPVVDRSFDEDTRARAAILTGVVEDGVRRGGSGLLEIGVREHDVRRLAAELESDPLDRPG